MVLGRPARTTRATGTCSGGWERQWKTKEPSITPTTNASSPPSGATAGIEVATLDRSRVARARVAPARRRSAGRCSPTPTKCTQRSASCVGAAERDGVRRDLAGLPGGAVELEQGERIEAQLLGDLVGTGAEQELALVPVGTRQHRQGDRLDAPDRVRAQVAERELGR